MASYRQDEPIKDYSQLAAKQSDEFAFTKDEAEVARTGDDVGIIDDKVAFIEITTDFVVLGAEE